MHRTASSYVLLLIGLLVPASALAESNERAMLRRAATGAPAYGPDRQTAQRVLEQWRDAEAHEGISTPDPSFERMLQRISNGQPLDAQDQVTAQRWGDTYDTNQSNTSGGANYTLGGNAPTSAAVSSSGSSSTSLSTGVPGYLAILGIGVGVLLGMMIVVMVMQNQQNRQQ